MDLTKDRLIQLGCGTNKLPAPWENYDREIDITKKLSFPDNCARAIMIEHCLEHVTSPDAFRFMKEALRVLQPEGVLRITVPNILNVEQNCNYSYRDFAKKRGWSDGSYEGAVEALITGHGHLALWNYSLMRVCLEVAGFAHVTESLPRVSVHPHLKGVEGHHKVIGIEINDVESMTVEATKR